MNICQFIFIAFFSFGLLAQENNISPYPNASEVGLDSLLLHSKIDSIIMNGIKNEAFPGAQVLVAKNGKDIFHKAYGFHTYDSVQPVSKSDMYDLASITKITAALPALMKLVDEGKLNLDKPFSTYWKPWRRQKDKKGLTLREILAHQAGLEPYIVFLNKVRKEDGSFKRRFVRRKTHQRFDKQAYKNLFVKNRFNRKVYRVINRSKVSDNKKYRYSGLTFLVFPKVIEQISGQPFEEYLNENFYHPLGLKNFKFNPMKTDASQTIVPTEIDTLFRKVTVEGWVHDENAALLGGISGNAGLFGTADDLAKMTLMFQNYGMFGGRRYLSKKTVREFVSIQYPENENRRGLGFDKPLLGNDTLDLKEAYPAPSASSKSFGHSGFTGTFVWADPEHQLTFIFLSNRVYPTRKNRNIYELNIRTKLHQLFYDYLIN